MSKAEIKSAMESLKVKLPLKLPTKAPSFHAPKALDVEQVREEKAPAASALPASTSFNREQSGSNPHPVQNEQGQNLTLSNLDPVKSEPCQKQTGSISPPVSRGPFTAVPHELLRGEVRFQDPIDFMIYLHLFSYSWGFGRETASMSQGQLEAFTGSTRNTIRRSLERLTEQGWIKMVEDYECARMSRRWKVITPEQNQKKKTGSISHPVKNGPCQNLTRSGSNLHPVTGSKFHPYKESIPKEKSKNSLSPENETLRKYFDELKPKAKRESEWQRYRDLRADYSETEIADALEIVHREGVGKSGSPCHSPMAFLSKAIGDYVERVRATREKAQTIADLENRRDRERREREIEAQREAEEWSKKEWAFCEAYPYESQQQKIIAELCQGMPFRPHTEAGRTFAVGKWWDGIGDEEES